ncbi:hypothetical protein GB937_008324 [Aspergillus fischeri]|nr:hypothetical protein GB937_008324 [Aspergillus fischeri]
MSLFLGGIRTPNIQPTKANAQQLPASSFNTGIESVPPRAPVEEVIEEERERREVSVLLDGADKDAEEDFDDEDDDNNQSVASENMDVDDHIAGKNALINEEYTHADHAYSGEYGEVLHPGSDITEPSSPLRLKQVISPSPPPYSGLFDNMIKSSYLRRSYLSSLNDFEVLYGIHSR